MIFVIVVDSETEELVSCRKKDTDGDQLGSSMHQSLHISDKFERSVASPDLFDSAPDNLIEVPPPLAAGAPIEAVISTAAAEAQTRLTPQDMSFDMDESLAECLIACTERVETEMRLSQQQSGPSTVKPAAISNSKKANKNCNRLQVTVISPKKQNQSPKSTKKAAAVLSKISLGREFTPKWVEKIKSATSPINTSLKMSQSGEKHTHRTLFTTTCDPSEKDGSKESGAALNKSFDPFEDSFETDLDQVLAAEAVALSQMVSANKVEPPATVSTITKQGQTEPKNKALEVFSSSACTIGKPAPKPINCSSKRLDSHAIVKPLARPNVVSTQFKPQPAHYKPFCAATKPAPVPQRQTFKPVQPKQHGSAVPTANGGHQNKVKFIKHDIVKII